eukprot:sb/3467082/
MVDLLQSYKENLTYSSDVKLQDSLKRVIEMCQSDLFGALLDIHEYQKDLLIHQPSFGTLNSTNSTNNNNNSAYNNNNNNSYLNYQSSPAEQNYGAEFLQNRPPPPIEEMISETILLEKGETGLGFSISGGYDTPHIPGDPRIYITKIIPNSVSDVDGRLRVNDCLVKVMDKDLSNVSHEEAVDTLKKSPQRVLLTIERQKPAELPVPRVVEVILNKGDKGLGISIAGGKGNRHIPDNDGIYITKIIPDGAADKDGTLQVLDRILSVNGIAIESVTHDEAVAALKSAGDNVTLVIAQNMPEEPTESGNTGP